MNDQSSPRPTDQPTEPAVTSSAQPVEVAPSEATQSQPMPQSAADSDVSPDGYGVVESSDYEPEEPITWQASEYVHHSKGILWYGVLAAIVIALIVVAVIFKAWLTIGVFLAMGAAIAVYAHKPPRTLTYALDSDAVTIEGKSYPYSNFHSFAVITDPDWHSIDLEPAKRFMPRLTILFKDEDFDEVVEHLSLHLPRTDRQPDLVERVTRYLRF